MQRVLSLFDAFEHLSLAYSQSEDLSDEASRDARLVDAAAQNADDFQHLIRLHQDRVYATALRLTHNESDAQDVAQEAFVKAYKNLRHFERGRRFSPWVCTIAANLAKDLLRKRKRRFALRLSFSKNAKVQHHEQEHFEANDVLAAALMLLAPKVREAIVLRFVSDMSIGEIADALSIKESAVKMRLKRGLDALKQNPSLSPDDLSP